MGDSAIFSYWNRIGIGTTCVEFENVMKSATKKIKKNFTFSSSGFVTQLSVTPTLTVTTLEAKIRFTPDQRACYFDDELSFDYLPSSLYR